MFLTSHFHPMIVHFPIALIITGLFAEIVFLFYKKETALSKTGFYLLLIGTLSALAAFTTGHMFTVKPTQGEMADIFTQHQTAAFVAILLMILASGFRIYLRAHKHEKSSLKWLASCLYLLGAAAVCYTGFLGGTMVYSYMISI